MIWAIEHCTGQRREGVEVVCLFCGKHFIARKKRTGRPHAQYCSPRCAYLNQRRRVTLVCAYCDVKFERTPSKIKNSKSGLSFCSRKCKGSAQSLSSSFPELRPPHYGTGNGRHDYRKRALQYYGARCEICGQDECVEVLQVHHIDGDRSNNVLENLIVLCPSHHVMITAGRACLIDRKLCLATGKKAG